MPSPLIDSKGQITIPKKIREFLRLQPGDRIDFVVDDGGKVVLEPITLDVKELEGILYRPNRKTVSTEDMKSLIRNRHAALAKKK